MSYDYGKLKGKIKERYGTQDNFAKEIGLSAVTLSNRLNNQTKFSQDEIIKCCSALDIEDAAIVSYFFTYKVQ